MRVLLDRSRRPLRGGVGERGIDGKAKFVRVVQHRGAITATLTYRRAGSRKDVREYSNVWLSVRNGGRLVVRHEICNVGGTPERTAPL